MAPSGQLQMCFPEKAKKSRLLIVTIGSYAPGSQVWWEAAPAFSLHSFPPACVNYFVFFSFRRFEQRSFCITRFSRDSIPHLEVFRIWKAQGCPWPYYPAPLFPIGCQRQQQLHYKSANSSTHRCPPSTQLPPPPFSRLATSTAACLCTSPTIRQLR